jgi:hypothetical protein
MIGLPLRKKSIEVGYAGTFVTTQRVDEFWRYD